VLVAGLLVNWPREQPLVFRLGPNRERITRIQAAWTRTTETEPAGGVTLEFPAPPPKEVRQRIRVPDGDYLVSVELTLRDPSGKPQETSWTGRVTLRGHETTLLVDDDPP
jgi:hypothetical protein